MCDTCTDSAGDGFGNPCDDCGDDNSDGLGRMITARRGTRGDPDLDSETIYTYDDLSRVTEESQKIGSATAKVIEMAYDQAGNRTRLDYPE